MATPFLIDPDAIYSDGDVRLGLRLTSATLNRARKDGRLKFTRQGKAILYRGQWLLDWLEGDAEKQREEKLAPNRAQPRPQQRD